MDTQTIDNQDLKLSRQFPTEVPNEVIESQTKKIPNLIFLGLAGASIIGSAVLAIQGRKRNRIDVANFVGLWAPSFLLFGVYNKIVKLETEVLDLSKKSVANIGDFH